ncbi:cellulase family glycosylhydrolase [Saccharothrix xinjiangensis]|uniref:cellulase n=1 Tax=Saccharothrix xinjiangensis TaxID=204798 RepID=A0ABV9YCI4_9PSEU
MKRRPTVLASVITAAVIGTGLAAVAPPASADTAGCSVSYAVQSRWPGGFTAQVSITNVGSPVSGWTLAFDFPDAGQRVSQGWSATWAQSGARVTAAGTGWNGSLGTNASTTIGFVGSWGASNPAPRSFALNGTACTGEVSPLPRDAMETVAAMQPGWNLGNSLDAIGADETAWGNPRVTETLLDHVRAQGFKSIRIPVTWSNRHGPAPDHTIDAAWLNRVREVVDWALADGFYVMINLHHDSWQWINTMPADRANVLDRYNALWSQLAGAFRDHSSRLVFESVNEPLFAGGSGDEQGYGLLDELNTSFHRLVRASGGANATRLLVLPTLFTNADQGRLDALKATFDRLRDPNLAATVHYYGFWPFAVNVAGHTRYDAAVEQDLVGTLERAHATFVTNGIPVILGEYGLLGLDHNRPGVLQRGEVLKFFEALGHHARSRNITTMLWDAGSFLNRTTLTWREPDLFAQIKSSWTARSGTASSDQVYVSRTGAITAESLTLTLNGTDFQGLRHGSTELVEGRDYTLSGTVLTLTAAAVTRLVGDRAHGVNTTVEARFSTGVPWRIGIISHDTPSLTDATGSTGSFAIPTEFRGDQLATMEAEYADGSNAGPHDWTSFKEFHATFQPDHGSGTILLKQALFDEVTDGAPVTLTFHFWSGARITYVVTKSGASVTGTANRS